MAEPSPKITEGWGIAYFNEDHICISDIPQNLVQPCANPALMFNFCSIPVHALLEYEDILESGMHFVLSWRNLGMSLHAVSQLAKQPDTEC